MSKINLDIGYEESRRDQKSRISDQTNGSGEDEENVLVVAKSNDEEGHEEGDGDQGKENYIDTNKEKDGERQVETIKQHYDGRVQKCGDSSKQNEDDQTQSLQKKIFLMF